MDNSISISTRESFLSFIADQKMSNGNLSIRGVARCCDVDHKAIITGGDFRSQKLGQTLTGQGFQAADLAANGFPPQAVWLCIEYFAYESKAKAPLAKQLARTFGSIGIVAALASSTEIKEVANPVQRILPQHTAVEYAVAAEKVQSLPDGILKQLLRDALVDELSLQQNLKYLPVAEKPKQYTIAKIRAKQLGYSDLQIGSGSALGRFVRLQVEPAFQELVGRFPVFHYEIDDRLDAAIRLFFDR